MVTQVHLRPYKNVQKVKSGDAELGSSESKNTLAPERSYLRPYSNTLRNNKLGI
jgi:hypothetical protein